MSSTASSSLSLLMNLSSSLVSLRLSVTKLQGNITSDILCFENLQQLDLSYNSDLNFQLPKSNWSSPLSFLHISSTTCLGEVLPHSVGHLKYLNHLNLGSCNFGGRVPLGLNNLTQLTYLDLSSNKFSGEISFLSNQEHLTHLYLKDNNFFGEIPSKISQLSKLVSLDLSYNFGMKESSSLILEPSIWEKLILNTTNLRVLRLSYVNMSSDTPNSLSLPMNVSSSLIYLSLEKTSLQGDITNTILQLENLKYLDLRENTNIKIQLPNSIGHLKSLEELYLPYCQFEGPIPPSFKSLTQLKSLYLSSNNFSGGISFLSALTQLTDLDSNNFLQ
ncbi:hypothetical protein K1719_046111 [Acacia pycnantha]|nr:hypothetical protein K1719_046111 [Acacia pycnantha]